MENKVVSMKKYQMKSAVKKDTPVKKMYSIAFKSILFYAFFVIFTLTELELSKRCIQAHSFRGGLFVYKEN